MWFPQNFASSASRQPRSATGFRAFWATFRGAIGAASGLALRTVRMAMPTRRPSQAQDEALAQIRHLNERKRLLLAEREILVAEIARAKRLHKGASLTERRLKLVVAELVSIG